MPRDKKLVTKQKAEKAHNIYRRAILLQRDMYDFTEVLKGMGMDDLAQDLEDGAFEMDLTWNNAKEVAKKLLELYVNKSY